MFPKKKIALTITLFCFLINPTFAAQEKEETSLQDKGKKVLAASAILLSGYVKKPSDNNDISGSIVYVDKEPGAQDINTYEEPSENEKDNVVMDMDNANTYEEPSENEKNNVVMDMDNASTYQEPSENEKDNVVMDMEISPSPLKQPENSSLTKPQLEGSVVKIEKPIHYECTCHLAISSYCKSCKKHKFTSEELQKIIRNETSPLKADIYSLRKELHGQVKTIKELKGTNEEVREYASLLEAYQFSSDQKIEELKKKNKYENSRNNRLKKENELTRNKIKRIKKKLKKMQAEKKKLEKEAKEKDCKLAVYKNDLQAKQAKIAKKEELIAQLKNKLASKESEIANKNDIINSKNTQITKLQNTLNSKNTQITNLNNALNNKENEITDKNGIINSKDTQITNLNNALISKQNQIANKNGIINSKSIQITNLNNALINKQNQIANKNGIISRKSTQITNLNNTLNSKQNRINTLRQELTDEKAKKDYAVDKIATGTGFIFNVLTAGSFGGYAMQRTRQALS